jgi:hypothetical protein
MFESSLLKKLCDDATLCGYVSTFTTTSHTTVPSIFNKAAPEAAIFPYITFYITQSSNECPAVKEFTALIDYFDNNKSSAKSNKAAERIEFLLDRAELEHDRYSCIRMFFFSGSEVPEEDPRIVHYNLQFTARAGRKKWINQL